MAGRDQVTHGLVADTPLSLGPADPRDEDAILAAVELGNRSRSTLGHMPMAVYREAAQRRCLVLARDGDVVIAYALYALTTRRIRLMHLCVAQDRRRQGVARKLADWISEHHPDYPGIVASCRHDYGLGPMWSRLGFHQVSERPGRGKGHHVLVIWWRDHGHPQIFARAPESVLVSAAVDMNVLRDLAEPGRTDRVESVALLSDQVGDRLELVRTPALAIEIDRLQGDLHTRCIREAGGLRSVSPDPHRAAQIGAGLAAEADSIDKAFRADDQGRLDIQHVAEAIAADLNVFITRDERLANLLGPMAARYGLRVLRPAEAFIHIDELTRAEAYRPASLQDTDFRRQLLGAGHERDLMTLVNKAARERPRELQARLRGLATTGNDRVGICGPNGELVAAYITGVEAGALNVRFLRVAVSAIGDTLARQLLFMLRQQARDVGAQVVRITDPHLSHQVALAALNDGFLPDEDGYFGFVLDMAGGARAVEERAVAAARLASVPLPPTLRSRMPRVVASEVERAWWPAKIVDSELSTYLIPIRQSFSAELIGVPPGLFAREAGLGLSREHVYYRSPSGPQFETPARLLWYMSGTGGRAVSPPGVIACSHLDDVVVGAPTDLHRQFSHLGVWTEARVARAARTGLVQALRFANTEILKDLVSLRRLRQLGEELGEHLIPQSPVKISSRAFEILYGEGRGHA